MGGVSKQYDLMTDYQKRAVDLLVNKFMADYQNVRSVDPGETLEHAYEVWSKVVISTRNLREVVWSKTLETIRLEGWGNDTA